MKGENYQKQKNTDDAPKILASAARKMSKEDILARNDCFNCGAECVYAEVDNVVLADCCNIDCPVSQGLLATTEQIASHRERFYE